MTRIKSSDISFTIGKLLQKRKKSLAVAESCTGGLLCSRLTQAPGASKHFLGGIISYSNDVKIRQLQVREKTLKKLGAVSAPVAQQMATNVRKLMRASFGIGITGIAGPTGQSRQKPVGLVYIAVADAKSVICVRHRFRGSRRQIQSLASDTALQLLRNKLLKSL